AGIAASLNLNCRATCAICRTAGNGHCGEHVEAAPISKLAWSLNLTHHVVGRKSSNRDRYFRVFQIFAAEFFSQRLLKLALCKALCLNGPAKWQRNLAG